MTEHNQELIVHETTERDLPDLARLWENGEVMRLVGYPDGLHQDELSLRRWLHVVRTDPTRHHFVVRTRDVGFCGELYYQLDPAHRRAMLDVKLVPEAQGRGLATAGLTRLIDLVFESEPEADAVWTDPVDENLRAHALYTRCGLAPTKRPADLGPGPSYWELSRSAWERRQKGPRAQP